MQPSMVHRHEARRAFLDTITHRCATETLRPFTSFIIYPLIPHGQHPTIRSHRYPFFFPQWNSQRKTGRKKKHSLRSLTNKITHNVVSRETKFSHVYRPRDFVPDYDDIVISPSLDGNTVLENFLEFLAANFRIYKRRIKRRRNFVFTKSKRARAVFEFSKQTLAFLLYDTYAFSRSRGRASNVRIFLF